MNVKDHASRVMCMRNAEIQTVPIHVAAIKDLVGTGIITVQVRVLKLLQSPGLKESVS